VGVTNAVVQTLAELERLKITGRPFRQALYHPGPTGGLPQARPAGLGIISHFQFWQGPKGPTQAVDWPKKGSRRCATAWPIKKTAPGHFATLKKGASKDHNANTKHANTGLRHLYSAGNAMPTPSNAICRKGWEGGMYLCKLMVPTAERRQGQIIM